MDIFKKLKELDLPIGEYVVIGSGILAALNLREANDLDIAVSDKLFKELQSKPEFKTRIKYGKFFLHLDDVEIISKLNWEHYPTTINEAINSALMINGFPFLNIEETIKFKRAMGRKKDFKDIELLENFKNRTKIKL